MRKRVYCIVLMILLLAGSIVGCTNSFDTEDAELFYQEYAESRLAKQDDFFSYLHYEDAKTAEVAKESFAWDELYSYEIRSVTQLSDKLWVIRVWSKTTAMPLGEEYVNFVGLIDGVAYVMTGYRQIPDYLSDGIDLESYKPTGDHIVDHDYVVNPIN